MSRTESKHTRLDAIFNLLLSVPEGLSKPEIARRMGVNRTTVWRDMTELTHLYPVIEEEDGRLRVDRNADLININLNLHEALAIHLASRLLATRLDRQNPHAATALRKLGHAMERWAQQISRHVLQSADLLDDSAQRRDPAYLQALERLTTAWAEQRQVRVWHRSERTGQVTEYRFCPYFIEPYPIGLTTMLIGFSDPPRGLRTLKIERIERVELTSDPYQIPDDFDPQKLLKDTWGIWYTEDEPVEVVLKFNRRVAHRVRETQWHHSEQIEEQPDGSLIWRARVAETQEMLPWIRGWGRDCEVLAPKKLRETMMGEARALAEIYGWQVRMPSSSDKPTLEDTFREFFGEI